MRYEYLIKELEDIIEAANGNKQMLINSLALIRHKFSSENIEICVLNAPGSVDLIIYLTCNEFILHYYQNIVNRTISKTLYGRIDMERAAKEHARQIKNSQTIH